MKYLKVLALVASAALIVHKCHSARRRGKKGWRNTRYFF